MKKILTLFIALILVAGIVSVAKSTNYDIDSGLGDGDGSNTLSSKDRHVVQSSDGTIVVFYQRKTTGGFVARKSTDSGKTNSWTKLDGTSGYTTIDSDTNIHYTICIDDNDNIYVAYVKSYDVFFKKLTAQAGTWTTWTVPGSPQTVEDTANETAYPSIIRQSNGRVWVAYEEDNKTTNAWLRAKWAVSPFTTWTLTTVKSGNSGGAYGSVYYPVLVLRNDSPYIVYRDGNETDLDYAIWYSTSSSWSGDTIYNQDIFTRFSVTLITTTVHVVYFSGGTLYHKYSSNNGTSWSSPVTVSTSDYEDDCCPSLTTNWDTDDVELWCYAAIYYRNTSSEWDNYNIKYKEWNGSHWDGSWTAVTFNNLHNFHPGTPSVSRGRIPVAWSYDDDPSYSPSDQRVKFNFDAVTLDLTAPEAIDDLAGTCPTGDVILTWSTPGDDGGSGTLPEMSGYRIDYSSVTKSWDKDDYEVWIPTHGVAPPTEVSYTVPSLQEDTTWYFRIWTRDEVPNWSGLSNGCTVWISAPSKTYNWTDGEANGVWAEPNNWEGAAGYPNAATDKAIIDLGSESINTPSGSVLTIGELELGSDYSGTLTLGGNFTLDDSGPWVANLTISNANAVLSLAGYNLTLESGSTFSNSGTLKLQGGETLTNFTNDTNSGTVEYVGDNDAAVDTYTITNVTTNYYNLTINSTGAADDVFQLGAELAMNGAGTLIVTSGVLYLNGNDITGASAVRGDIAGTIRLYGDESVFWGANDTDSGTYEYVGNGTSAGDYTIKAFTGTTDYYHLTINSTLGVTDTFRLPTSNLIVAGNFTLTAGTFNTNDDTTDRNLSVTGNVDIDGTFTANSSTITVAGNWDSSGGTLNPGTSTVTFNGTAQTISGATTLFHLQVQSSSQLDINDTTVSCYDLTVQANKKLRLNSASDTLTVTDSVYNYGIIEQTNGTVNVNDTEDYEGLFNYSGSTCTISGGTLNIVKSFMNRGGTLNISGSAAVDVDFCFYNTNGYNSTINMSGGTVDCASFPNYEGTVNHSGGTITSSDYYREYDSDGGNYYGSGTALLKVTAYIKLMKSGTYFNDLEIIGSSTYIDTDSTESLNINGDFTIGSGKAFDTNGTDMYVGGDWSNSGTFIADSNTVTFDGTGTSTLTGSTTFYVLVSTTTNKTVQVLSDTVIGVTGHLNFENITLQSTSPGATWYLNLSGDQDVHHVDVRDSNADDGNTIYAGCSTDSGNNTNWIFDDSILTWDGDVDTDWNEPENWNFSIVPLSTHTVIIPNVTNDPQLTSNVIISSITIETDGQLYLEGYNITVSSDVYLHGSLICAAGEQITVGGSWDSSGGTFTAANSTATFNGSGSFNILSSGTTFYNLAFNNSVSTWTLTDALSCTNISVVNGTLNDAGNTVTVNGNITFPESNKVTSTGTWIQAANGNITGYVWGNKLGVYQINSGVTVTMSGGFAVKKLVMQANSTLSGSGKTMRTFPVANDFWDIDNTASVTLATLADNDGTAFTQKGLSPDTFNVNTLVIEIPDNGTLTLTGNWNIPNTNILVLRNNGICTLDTSSYDVTAKGLYVGYSSNYNGKLDLGSGSHVVSEGLGLYPAVTSANNEIDLDSCNISVGGNVDFTNVTVTPGTSTVTFSAGVTNKTITSASQSFDSVVFDSSISTDTWTLQDSFTCSSLQVVESSGTLIDNGWTVTVNGNIDIANTSGILTSTGLWIQGANGNISNPNAGNIFNTLQIANNVTSTRTGAVYTKKIVLGTNAILQGFGLLRISPTVDDDDFIDMGTDLSITDGGLWITLPGGTTLMQKAFSVSASVGVVIRMGLNSTIQMTGDWTTGYLHMWGSSGADTEEEALVLDTNGYNLTVNSFLRLGYSGGAPNKYYAKVLFSTGTHSISGEVYVDGKGEYTYGYFDLGSADISIVGNVNFSSATVTPGTSTVTLNGSSGTQTVTSWSQSFYDLTINNTGTNVQLQDAADIDGDLTIQTGTLDLNGKDLTHTAGKTFSNDGTLKLQGGETLTDLTNDIDSGTVLYVGNGDSSADTYTLKDFTGTDYYHLIINSTDGATDTFRASTATVAGNFTLTAGKFDLNGRKVDVSGNFLNSNGTLYMYSNYDKLDIAGNFTVTGGTADITAGNARIYIGGNIDISGDNSFNPSNGYYYMDSAGDATISITGANNDLGYGTNAYFFVNKTNSTDTVTLLTDMASNHFIHYESIFDVNGHNASFSGVYYGYNGSKLQMSSGTFRCGKNGSSGGTFSPWYCASGWTENISGGTITVYGGKHATYGTAYFADGSEFTPTGGTFELVGTDDSSIHIAEEDDADFNFYNLTIGDGTNTKTVEMDASSKTLDVDGNLTIKTNATFDTSGKAIEVAGNVDIDDTFNANGSTITVSGNWDSYDGVFNYGTSTVDLVGTGTSTLTGSCTFYVLVSTTTEKTVQVSSDTVIGVTGHLNFEYITLLSTLNGATWYLNLSGDQDVHHVDVRDSNAEGGKTIYARSSTDLGNNTNWVFDDWLLTWDGSESTNWDTAANWNFNIVPLSTHTVIIPDGTPYDPHLTSNVIISSITIQTGGQLSLEGYNITVSSDVYLHGSLICAAGEQITVGGNWSAYSGAIFTASSSTVTFNASSGTKNILSSGTTFYNLVITTTTTTATYELSDELYVQNNFTLLNGTFDTNNSGNYVVNVGSSVYINGGTFEAGASTITCGANWDSSGGTFNYDQSTVDLTGTGNLTTSGSGIHFYNLKVAASDKTTTLQFATRVAGTLTLGNGALTDGASSYSVVLYKNSGAPLIHGGATIKIARFYYRPSNGTVTVAEGNYGTLDYLQLFPSSSNATFNLGGNVTVNGTFFLVASGGTTGAVCDTQNNNITATRLFFGNGSANGSTTLNCGSSTIDIGTGGVNMANNGGSHIFNLSSATVTCAGNWELVDGTGTITQIPGTSTVTFDGGVSQTLSGTFNGSTSNCFKHLTVTGSGTAVTSPYIHCLGNLTINTGASLAITTSGDGETVCDVDGYIDVNGTGTFDADGTGTNEKVYCAGNWSNDSNSTIDLSPEESESWNGGLYLDGSSNTTITTAGVNLATDIHIFKNSPTDTVTLVGNVKTTHLMINEGKYVVGEYTHDSTGVCYVYSGGTLNMANASGTFYARWSGSKAALWFQEDSAEEISNGTIILPGSNGHYIDAYGSTFTPSGGLVQLSNSASADVKLGSGSYFHNLEVAAGAYTATLASNIDVHGNLTITSGTLDASISNYNIEVQGNWTNNGGTFTAHSGTVTFYGTGDSTLTGSTTFYVLISTTSTKTVKFTSDTIIGVTNHLNFENITLQSTSPGATWYLNLSGDQDVHDVDVRDSNASGGSTIFARSSTDSGNNTNWVFDDSILTWDGSESTDWNTAENWNFNIVPLSTHTVIIPDGTPYDPHLTSNVIISSITIQTGGQLYLEGYNITVSSDVYLHGSLICAAGEQITVGGNWSAYSGAIFTASSSTVTFNASSGTKNILTSGTTFYNLVITTATTTAAYELSDALYVQNNFTLLNGTFDTNDSGNYVVNVGSSVYINGGTFEAGASTITCGANWDSSAGTFNYDQSTVDLTGTGTINIPGDNWWTSFYFYNLKCAAGGETTTLLHNVGVNGTLTLGSGTLSGSGYTMALRATGTPFVHGGAAITLNQFIYYSLSGTITVTGGDYGTLTYLFLYSTASDNTYNFGGNVTVNGIFYLVTNEAYTGNVANTQDYNLTASGLRFGAASWGEGDFTLNCGSSIIDIGTSGLDMANNGGFHTFNLNSSTITCAGNWQLSEGSGSIDQNWGTSTVTFDGTGTSTLTGSTTFYVLVSTTTENLTVRVSSDTVIGVTNHLNFENITLRSTSSGATWYLNLSGTQDVSNVDVRDSNASDGDTILDFDCPYIESCYYGNNTNWDFGPPAAITDLTGECNSDTGYVTLYWSTPGDDEWIGVLSSTSEYRIDYSTDSSRQWGKDTYEVSIPTYGVTPNTEVSRIITGLTGGTTWYFRIWTADEIPLWSDLSNGCTIWVNPILSVSISTNTYDFGDVPLGVSTHTVSIITVTNDGNLTEDFGLSCTTTTLGGSPWYPGLVGESSDYYNRFILRGVFNETEVATDDFGPEDTIEEGIRWSQATSTFTVTGAYTGVNVEADGDRNIWFRLDLPTTSGTSKDQQITVTITAKEPD